MSNGEYTSLKFYILYQMDDLDQFLEFLFEILFAYFTICWTKYLNFLLCRFHKSRLEFFAL